MPNAYGRAFTTANFLSNLAALKAINFGASDPSGVWFLVKNSTGNSDIWLWEPTSMVATNETSVVRPDSIEPNSPGRCVKSLVDANSLGGILAAIALLNTAGLIERTADGSAAIVGLGAFARTFLGSASDSAARTTLNLGNVTNTSDAAKPVSTAQQTALNLKANLASPTFTGTVAGITAAMVGLGNVTNTSDANKPISTAQQTALNLKADLISGTVPAAQLPSFLALGITSSSAYRGDLGNTAYLHSQETGNPHQTTAAQIGLSNLTNHLQVNTTENQTVGGEKTLTGIVRITNTTQSTSTTTGAQVIAGGQAVGGNQFVGGKICPTIAPITDWGLDFTTGGSTITLATGATYDLAVGSGMVVIYDNIDGNFNFMFATAGNVVSVAASASSSIVAGSPPSDKVGLFYNAGTLKYRISNNRASTRTLILSTFKMRGVS